jgi:hypothetical protein
MAQKPSNKLPDGIDTSKLQEYWNIANTYYWRAFRKIFLLDAADRGRMWEAIKAKLPPYQILVDTNHVSYVKENILASIYTVGKSAQLLPTSEDDKDAMFDLNIMLEHIWDVEGVTSYQFQAGERAALTNLGITQVGWDATLSRTVFKNIDPTKFMRDPFSSSLDTAGYCMTWDMLHKSYFESNPNYKDTFAAYLKSPTVTPTGVVDMLRDRPDANMANGTKDYYRLLVFWVKVGDKIHEIHTIDATYPLYVKENIVPNMFPFALLYCNEASGDLIGTSAPAKIFTNSLAYNLMMSTLLTAEYRNQRPPVFINADSGINIASFIKHANDADYTFPMRGNVDQAVKYHQFPQPSAYAQAIGGSLTNDMQLITGVDGRYTGRDTGSVLTTGGIESMLDQVTLIDTPKIQNYEAYTKRLTQLVLKNLVEFAQKRKYFVKNPKDGSFMTIEVDFPQLNKRDVDTLFTYAISISTELPKNKARLAQMANTLMEKQMQYAQNGGKVDFITPEEWLMLQDLPIREYMQQRMGIQRSADYMEKVTEVLTTFAEQVKQGVPPADAMANTAAMLQAKETPGMELALPEVAPDEQAGMAEQAGAVMPM